MRRCALMLALVALSGTASAQDGAWGNLAGDLALSNLRHQQMEDALGIDTWSAEGQRQLRQGRTYRPSRPDGRPTAAPARQAATRAFPFRSTPASRQAAMRTYVSRIERDDPIGANAARTELSKHGYARIYASLVAPFGLRPDDAADTITAYTLLGHIIATGAGDPTPAQVRAVRTQVAARAATNRAVADPASRLRMAEELQLSFVTLHAGWQSARRDGSLPRYANGVARLFEQNGMELRRLRLTDQGLVPE